MTTRQQDPPDLVEEVEEVDALPVTFLAQTREVILRPSLPTVAQAAAVAVTGFAAGAVTAAVVGRSRSRRTTTPVKRPSTDRGLIIQSTQSFLVDVHVLAPRG